MRFDPEGITGNPEIPFAKSMPDYIMRWLASRFLDADIQEELGILTARGARPQGVAGGADARGHRRPGRGARSGGNGHANGGNGGTARRRRQQPEPAARAHRRAAGAPGEAARAWIWARRAPSAAE